MSRLLPRLALAMLFGLALPVSAQRLGETYYALDVSPDGRPVLRRYQRVETVDIDTGNLNIDSDRLRTVHVGWWLQRPDIRYYLLESGVASLKNADAEPEEYRAAAQSWANRQRAEQTESRAGARRDQAARAKQIPRQRARAPVEPQPSASWNRTWNWIKVTASRFWYVIAGLLGFIAATQLLPVFYREMKNWAVKRDVVLFYTGLPGSGKTALIDRIRDPSLPESYFDNSASTPSLQRKKHDPIALGGLRFFPTFLDTSGAKPDEILDELLASRKTRRRYVLLIVVAPSIEATDVEFDAPFLSEQLGYLKGLPKAIISSSKLSKPKAVLLFANKSDGFADPGKPAGQTLAEFLNCFKEHVTYVSDVCKTERVQFVSMAGSARMGINTDRVLNAITNKIS